MAPWKRGALKMLGKIDGFLMSTRKSVLTAETEEGAATAFSLLFTSLGSLHNDASLLFRKHRRFEERRDSKKDVHAATAARHGVGRQQQHSNTRIGDLYKAAAAGAAAAGKKRATFCKFWNTGLEDGCDNGDACAFLHDEAHAAQERLKNEAATRSAADKRAAKARKQQSTMSGTVKVWQEEKGFGFISPHDQTHVRGDLFVHATDLVGGNCLVAGMKVHFDLGKSEKGPNAVLVNGDGVANTAPSSNNRKRAHGGGDSRQASKRGRGNGQGRRR